VKTNLHLTITDLTQGRSVGFLEKYLPAAHKKLRSPLRDLAVTIVGEPLMRRLHKQYMNDAAPTDVLTFQLDAHKPGRSRAGEIVICLPVARRAARRRKIPLENELLLYALHGLLHLTGFDDRTEAGYQAMHEKEDQILTQLGIGPVFHARIFPSPRYSGESTPCPLPQVSARRVRGRVKESLFSSKNRRAKAPARRSRNKSGAAR
jgi:probable rRNA maturation factor